MRRSDLTLQLAAAALVLAAAAYAAVGIFDASTVTDSSEIPQIDIRKTLCLEGLVQRDEITLCAPEGCFIIPREGDFVSGGEVLCVWDEDAYFAALDKCEDYDGKCVRSPVAGYFCTDLCDDGQRGAFCRIVCGASWYFSAETDEDFAVGETVTLTINGAYSATVQSVDGGTVVFRVREGLYSVLSLRYETATVLR